MYIGLITQCNFFYEVVNNNLYVHGLIETIFGTNVAEKVANQNALYFLTSLN